MLRGNFVQKGAHCCIGVGLLVLRVIFFRKIFLRAFGGRRVLWLQQALAQLVFLSFPVAGGVRFGSASGRFTECPIMLRLDRLCSEPRAAVENSLIRFLVDRIRAHEAKTPESRGIQNDVEFCRGPRSAEVRANVA